MFTIGQVSEMFNLPVSTLRYYDKEGFFPNLERKGNIRYFSDNELEALRIIECLKKSEIKQVIENERNQIKQIFEIEFAKNTKELRQVIEAENKTLKISVWVSGGLTLIMSILAVIKLWT